MWRRICLGIPVALLAACGDRPQPEATPQPSRAVSSIATAAPASGSADAAPSPLDILRTDRQEKLYYTQLPAAVIALGKRADIPVADVTAAMARATEPLIRFNLVLVLEQQLKGNVLPAAEQPKAVAMVERALGDGSAWVRTEAAYTLGCIRDAHALPALTRMLDDPAPTVVLEAASAFQRMRGALPAMTPAQAHMLSLAGTAAQNGTIEDLADQELIRQDTL